MTALDKQVSGTHYKDLKIQPIEYIQANGLDYFQGNVVKYVTRHKSKDGKADIQKAIHYLEMILQFEYGENVNPVVDNDGWIEWTGGQCPVNFDRIVKVKFRDLRVTFKYAGNCEWNNNNYLTDIIAYKLVK